jgi:hypothetical protein
VPESSYKLIIAHNFMLRKNLKPALSKFVKCLYNTGIIVCSNLALPLPPVSSLDEIEKKNL